MTVPTNFNEYREVLSNLNNAESILGLVDDICDEMAKRFNLYGNGGRPRKATIIETLSNFTCLACIYRRLLEKPLTNNVDAIYKECHKLAVNILVERLYWLLNKMGYNVAISTEAELDYSKADIVIAITKLGISLKHKSDEIIVEVKTGNSLSLSQLFRYLLSGKSNSIIVWRIRKRQILVFKIESLKPLLAEFATMIYLRANRLLSSSQISCQHEPRRDYHPTQEELQIAIQEFGQGLLETLPHIIAVTFQELGLQNWEAKLLDIKQT
ncbi:MAG: hypothetical protein ACPLYF_05025 [Fervidobacterium sp.]